MASLFPTMACIGCSLLYISATIVLIGVIIKIYFILTKGSCKSQTCLVGKTAIVTGANTGIGYETALDFAKRGARVILACRDEKRAEIARDRIIEETGNNNVIVRIINMSSFTSVRTFAKMINETEERLDILVNNAGAGGIGDKRSDDGHVLLMQINYFSPFLLTVLLLGLLKKTGESRVVNVSSVAAKFSMNFDVNLIDVYPGLYSVYANSKLCNILFTIELAERLKHTAITTYSVHPGGVKTDIFRRVRGSWKSVLNFFQNVYFKTCEEGAQTTIYCSVAKEVKGCSGEHFVDCRREEPYRTTKVPGLSKKLWEVTREIVQLKHEDIAI